jgi:4-amino-4-deoxy-L-arabinose transferase-like glycosyltransferase
LSDEGVRDNHGGSSGRRTVSAALARARAALAGAVRAVRQHPWLTAALVGYGVLLLAFRPPTPFEWDEVLFQRALDDYNVARHSPHPPGYPLYVGAAKVVRFLVRDPLLALQIVGVLAALAALVLTYRLASRAARSGAAGLAAAGVLAVVPAFAFYANVGMWDVASTAAGLAALAALLAALERPETLPWAAGVCALALGVRPQLVALLLPLGAAVLVAVAKRGEWRRIAAAAVVGLVVTDLIWLPAAYATGPGFWAAWKDHAHTLSVVERGLRMPGARVGDLVENWCVRGFGSPFTAWSLWGLAALGLLAWLRAGRRRLVAVCASATVAYVAAGLFTMNMTTANRYVLPVVPLLAVLAAGLTTLPWRAVRLTAMAALGAWAGAALVWAAPVYALRRQPAPTWAGLSMVREKFDPSRTTVVFDGFFEPHVQYLLQSAGFTIVKSEPTTTYGPWLRPDGAVLYACPKPVAGGEVVFSSRWGSEKLRSLTRNRYDECAITRAPAQGEPVYSPEWRVRDNDWELWGTGAICLPEHAVPKVLLLQAGDAPLRVRRAAWPQLTVKPGAPAEAALMPGAAGCLLVNGPGGVHSHFPPVQAFPLKAGDRRDEVGSAFVVPLLARMKVPGGGEWRTDVFLANLGAEPLPLVAQYLPRGRDNSTAPAIDFTLPAGASYVVADVVGGAGLAHWGDLGAMLLRADPARCSGDGAPCSFTVFSRTYNSGAARLGPRLGEGLPALAARRGLYGGGRATFEHVSNDAGTRGFVNVVTWIPGPVHATLTLRDGGRTTIGESDVEIPPFGEVFVPFPGSVTDGQLSVQLVKPPANALFYPSVTLVDQTTGEPTHLLASPSRKEAPPEWFSTHPGPLPAAGAVPVPEAPRRR